MYVQNYEEVRDIFFYDMIIRFWKEVISKFIKQKKNFCPKF